MKVDRTVALSVSLSVNINMKKVKFTSSFWNSWMSPHHAFMSSCDYYNKQRLVVYTALAYWSY